MNRLAVSLATALVLSGAPAAHADPTGNDQAQRPAASPAQGSTWALQVTLTCGRQA